MTSPKGLSIYKQPAALTQVSSEVYQLMNPSLQGVPLAEQFHTGIPVALATVMCYPQYSVFC